MRRHFLLTFFILSELIPNNVVCTSYNDYVRNSLTEMCPYSSFCTSTASLTLQGSAFSACCKPCSCNADCVTRNDCCPDSAFQAHEVHPMAPCQPLAYFWSARKLANLNGFKDGIALYNTVASCPDDFPDTNIVSRCEGEIQNLEDAVAVSSDRVFKNRLCAECNGITEYSTWELQVFCLGAVVNERITRLDLAALRDKHCMLQSTPPKSADGRSSRCFRPQYTACNQTGKWEKFDANLIQACQSYTLPYLGKTTPILFEVYKNPFCYLCNKDQMENTATVCPADVNDTPKFFKQQLRMLINSDYLTATRKKEGQYLCKIDEVHDPYFNTCRRLTCPVCHVQQYGRCTIPYTTTSGFTLQFRFTLTISSGSLDTFHKLILEKENGKILMEALMQTSQLKPIGCKYGNFILYRLNSTSAYTDLVSVDIFTTKTCPFQQVADRLRHNANGTMFKILMKEESFKIYSELTYDPSYLVNHMQLLNGGVALDYAELNRESSVYILVNSPKFYCGYVELSVIEYTQIRNGVVRGCLALPHDFAEVKYQKSKDAFIAAAGAVAAGAGGGDHHVNDAKRYRICLNDYIISRTNTGFSHSCSTMLIIVLAWLQMTGTFEYYCHCTC